MSRVRRGTVLSFSATDWTALILLDGADFEAQIPVGQWIPSAMMTATSEVAVLVFGDTDTDDAVVLGPYGAVSSWSFPAIGSAANGQLLIGNGSGMVLATITGTANQVTVTNGAGTITLSGPQDLATASAPTFAGLTSTGNITATNSYATGLITGMALYNNSYARIDRDGNANLQGLYVNARWNNNGTPGDFNRINTGAFGGTASRVVGSGNSAQMDIGSAADPIVWTTRFKVDSTGIGFFNIGPAARPTGYTQTYATTTRTHANPTATTPAAYAAGANGYSTAAKAQEMRDQIAALVADVANIKQVLNSVIDDQQAYGLFA